MSLSADVLGVFAWDPVRERWTADLSWDRMYGLVHDAHSLADGLEVAQAQLAEANQRVVDHVVASVNLEDQLQAAQQDVYHWMGEALGMEAVALQRHRGWLIARHVIRKYGPYWRQARAWLFGDRQRHMQPVDLEP